jgi:hypothetical protein
MIKRPVRVENHHSLCDGKIVWTVEDTDGIVIARCDTVEIANEIAAALTADVERLKKWYHPPVVDGDMCSDECPYMSIDSNPYGDYDRCTIDIQIDEKPHPDCIAINADKTT